MGGEWTKKAARYFAIFCFVAILATSLFNMAICLLNALSSMRGMITPLSSSTTPLPSPSPPPAYDVASQMSEKYETTIQSNPAFVAAPPAFLASPPPTASNPTPTASERETPADSGDGLNFLLGEQLNLEALVTQSLLGINPFLLLPPLSPPPHLSPPNANISSKPARPDAWFRAC